MATQGANYPSTRVASQWVGAFNLLTDNGSYASYDAVSIAVHTAASIIVTNYGFTIPTGATINGILVEIKRYKQSLFGGEPCSGKDNVVKLRKANATDGTTNKASTTNWNTSPGAYTSYGGATDLWGDTWTPADINSTNFGAKLIVQTLSYQNGDGIQYLVDTIRITVYYTESGGGASLIKSVNSLVKASVKSIDSLVIASVKSINGLG